MAKIKVVQFGLGAMGSMMAKIMLEKKSIDLVGAVVRDENKNGKDIGEIIGLKKKTGIRATTDANKLYQKAKGGVLIHAAVSYVPEVWKQIKPAVEAGLNVITIAEEMGYPFIKYPKICKEMDALAKKRNISIIGTGINPGFAMDLLPILLTGICKKVDKIKVIRVIDFSPFGPAIQQNIGIGMDVDKSAEIYKLLQPTGKPIVFAGGLSPENVGERISQLYNKLGTTNFSIDAESSLRTNDRLDLDKVDKYIVEATSAFKQLKNK